MNAAEFLESFEPKDWVTAGLSVAAIIVAVWSALQKWRYHPRPILKADESFIYTDSSVLLMGGPYVRIAVSNRGNGPAHDVVVNFEISTWDDSHREVRLNQIGPGEAKSAELQLAEEGQAILGGMLAVSYNPSSVDPSTVKVYLTWRQSPSMWLTRKKRLKLDLRSYGL